MFGVELIEVLIFFRQFAIAVVGASTLWGLIFLFFSRISKNKRDSAMWQGIAQRLLQAFFLSLFAYGLVWAGIAVLECAFCVSAHEGISIAKNTQGLPHVMQQQFALYVALMLVGISSFCMLFWKRFFLLTHLSILYGISFILVSAILLYPWGALLELELGSLRNYTSLALHDWHSILTLGSVVLVDFLFVTLKANFRSFPAKIFPLMTRGIWIGLGLDFISSGLILNKEFLSTDRILFMQTLIGIIIINGVLLSGPISRAVLSFHERMQTESLPKNLDIIAGISGALSITTWISITALDGFRAITLSYSQLALAYVLFFVAFFASRKILEKFIERSTSGNRMSKLLDF